MTNARNGGFPVLAALKLTALIALLISQVFVVIATIQRRRASRAFDCQYYHYNCDTKITKKGRE